MLTNINLAGLDRASTVLGPGHVPGRAPPAASRRPRAGVARHPLARDPALKPAGRTTHAAGRDPAPAHETGEP